MRNIVRNLLAAVSLVAVSLGNALSPAMARTEWSPIGGAGDQAAKPECPPHEILVGFGGRTGAWIDQIQIYCAPMQADGTAGASYPARDNYGGFGGAPREPALGGPGSRIATIHVALTTDNRMVNGLAMTCVDRAGNVVRKPFFAGKAPDAVGYNSSDYKTRSQGLMTTYGATHDFTCPDENFAGALLRFGKDVNAIGFICAARTPLAAAAPAPAAPVAPAKPIKHTGRGGTAQPAAASGPPLALRSSISGPWKLVANGTEHYNLVLTAQGDGFMLGRDNLPFSVVGTLASADGSPAMQGTFSASMLPTRQLQGGYGQKNGASGQCLLTYAVDGQTLAGDCARGNESVRWTATRGSWPAEAATAPRLNRAALHAVEVKMSVDVYAAPGGNGASIGQLNAGTAGVELVQACQDNWCHVRWPGHEGWVYSGPDYNSLDQ